MTICNCSSCNYEKADFKIGKFVCPAYPEGIPQTILDRANEKLKTKPCNPKLNNIKWEQLK